MRKSNHISNNPDIKPRLLVDMVRHIQPHHGREQRPCAECARAERRHLGRDFAARGRRNGGFGRVGCDVGGGEGVVWVRVVEAGGVEEGGVGLDRVAYCGYGDLRRGLAFGWYGSVE
jgi:hypothetical protein